MKNFLKRNSKLLKILKLGKKLLTGNKGYPRYPLSYTPLRTKDVIAFIKKNNRSNRSLVVVPTELVPKVQRLFNCKAVDTLQLDSIDNLDDYKLLLWATDRADTNARAAQHFISSKKRFIPMRDVGPGRNWHHDPIKEKVLRLEFELQSSEGIEKFGHGSGADFGNLLQVIDQTHNLNGAFVELGCFFGSSSCAMVRYMTEKGISKKFFFYDVFEGFTYKEALTSSDSTWADLPLKTDGRDAVEKRILSRGIAPSNLLVIKRNVCEPDALKEIDGKIAFANIDVDLYEAVYAALHHVYKKLIKGGIIVVEDAGHTPWLIGATAALNHFLSDVGAEKFNMIQMESGQYLLILK